MAKSWYIMCVVMSGSLRANMRSVMMTKNARKTDPVIMVIMPPQNVL